MAYLFSALGEKDESKSVEKKSRFSDVLMGDSSFFFFPFPFLHG